MGDTGLSVSISDGPAADQLKAWARKIGDRGVSNGATAARKVTDGSQKPLEM